ncbi:hypothetical protein BDL97_09G074000 [Sphagnum fallax]|nr:hypothetical protein BDL97_09G074000 [Sphagnum fallax]
MAATLSLALDLCNEIQEKYSLILVESKNSPLIHRNQCMVLFRKLSDTRETLVAVQHKLSDGEFTSSQSSDVGTPVIHGLIHVLKRVHEIFFKDCFCKDKWLEAALRQGGDLKETFAEIVSDLQWYRSVLHSIVFKRVGQDSNDLAPVDCNRNLSEIELEALSTAAKWDQEDLRGFLREFNGDPARNDENGNYISMQCLATQLLNKLEFQPWSPTAKEKRDKSLHEDGRNKWSEGPLVLLVNMQDLHKGALLGEGSFGSVHETNWLGETYAMKIHKRGLKECLKAEIKALAGLQHPHVIRLVGCAEEEGKCLYLMERMDKSLSKMLEDCSLSLVQRVDMMLQIAEGVRYLHSKNLVHRDLKPENILVKHDNSGPETLMLAPLVEDFWIAKVSDFGTMKEKMESMAYVGQTMNVGTTMFMVPEMYQLEDSAKRPERFHPMKTDVYSFALICFVVLTSESTPFPFEELMNPSVREFKDRVRRGKRPKLPANCPVDLSDLIQQCWDGNQDGRPNFDYICTELRQIKDFLLTGTVKEEGCEIGVTIPHNSQLNVEGILASQIRMSEGIRDAVKEVESFKQECLELDRKVNSLASLLEQAVHFSITNPAGLYESPTQWIAMEVEKTLERALGLVKKCRWSGMLQRVITNTRVSDFQKVNLYLDNSIANVQYLLNISASREDRPIHIGLPPIASHDPVLSIVWENVSILHVGNAEEKAQGASCLADLAKGTRNRSIICKAGGVPPLQRLLREGTAAGQEEAARALGYLAADRSPVLRMQDKTSRANST